jgi:hypothetical protein
MGVTADAIVLTKRAAAVLISIELGCNVRALIYAQGGVAGKG